MEEIPLDSNGAEKGAARNGDASGQGRIVLPPRRESPTPVKAEEFQGLRIGVNPLHPVDDEVEVEQDFEIVDYSTPVTRLGKEAREKVKAPGEIKLIERESRTEMQRKHRGETEDWGTDQAYPVRWIVGSLIGVFASAIIGFFVVSLVNKKESVTPDELQMTTGPAIRESDEDVAVEELINSSKEASQLFEAFSRVATSREILPLIRSEPGIEDLVRKARKATLADSSWRVDENASWVVEKSGDLPIAKLTGTFPDGEQFQAYFIKSNGGLLLDWKATTAYSTATFLDLRKGKGNASEVRGILEPSVYYTPSMPEGEYLSFSFTAFNGEDMVWVYLTADSPLREQLLGYFRKGEILDEGQSSKPLTLALEKGPAGSLPNQWMISSILSEEWITNINAPR